MLRPIILAALAALVLDAAPALDMRDTKALEDPSAPSRGMTMDRVASGWGEPRRRIAAVGEPPITRWQYEGFTVYFEHDRVIHTVVNRG